MMIQTNITGPLILFTVRFAKFLLIEWYDESPIPTGVHICSVEHSARLQEFYLKKLTSGSVSNIAIFCLNQQVSNLL